MKFNHTIYSLILVILMGMIAGCDQDQKTLLTDGTWNFENLTTDSEDENTQNLVFLAKALMTESTMEFKADGTYLNTSPLMEEPASGSWSLIGDEQLILTPDDGLVSKPNIEVLSKTELKYVETLVDQEMNTYTIKTSWTKN